MPAKIFLTPKQEKWLRAHYKHTKNDEVMARLGLKFATLHRFVRQLGLKKSKQFMRKIARQNSELAWLVNRAKGWPPKGYIIPNCNRFKKGESNIDRIGVKRWEAAQEKRRLTWLRNREADKRRVLFGLEQKTKFRVTKQTKSKVNYRYKMRKTGYIETGDKNVLYYPNEEMRHQKAELNAAIHHIKILPLPQTIITP